MRILRFFDVYVRMHSGTLVLALESTDDGRLIGTIFEGMLYDQHSQMNMTGTFMLTYGLNHVFGELLRSWSD